MSLRHAADLSLCTAVLGLSLGWPVVVRAASGIEAGLLFNTVCAQCHEGECTGRLSFSSGPEAAVTHTRRYAGEVSEATVRELFGLLKDMKQRCTFAPMPVVVPADGIWSAGDLASLRDPTQRWYFIPLGTLTAGDYRLDLTLSQSASLGVEVISSDFERLLDEPLCVSDGTVQLTLSVSEPMPYHLRIAVRAPVVLTKLELSR